MKRHNLNIVTTFTLLCSLSSHVVFAESLPDSRQELIKLMRTGGGIPAGMEMAERMVKADPKDAFAYCAMGDMLKKSGRFDLAKDAYKKAVDVAPHGDVSGDSAAYQIREIEHMSPSVRGYSAAASQSSSATGPFSASVGAGATHASHVKNYVNFGGDTTAPYIPQHPDLKAVAQPISAKNTPTKKP